MSVRTCTESCLQLWEACGNLYQKMPHVSCPIRSELEEKRSRVGDKKISRFSPQETAKMLEKNVEPSRRVDRQRLVGHNKGHMSRGTETMQGNRWE